MSEDVGLKATLDTAEWDAGWAKFLAGLNGAETESQQAANVITESFDKVDQASLKLGGSAETLNAAFTKMLDQIESGTSATKAAASATGDLLEQAGKGIGPLAQAHEQLSTAAKKSGEAGREGGHDLAEGAQEGHRALNELLDVMGKIPGIGPGIREVTSTLNEAGEAGSAAGAAISSSWALAIIPIAAVVAVLGAVIVAAEAAGSAVETAVAFAEQVTDVQRITGTGGQFAQDIVNDSVIAGTSIHMISLGFEQMNAQATAATESAANGLNQMGASAANTSRQLQRLGDDYQRNVADVAASSAQRLSDIESSRQKLSTTFYANEADKQSAFNKAQADAAAHLQQQLEDMSRQHAQTISNLKLQMSELTDSFEQQQADRQTKLQDDLTRLTEGYEARKDQINAKYYAPRSAREVAARDEELALLEKQYGAEQDNIKKRAKTEEDRAQEAFEKHKAAIQRQIDSDNEQYARQTTRLKEEDAKRTKDATEQFDKQTVKAKAAYEEQLVAFKTQQDRIQKETDKRLDDLTRSYNRQLEDISTSTAAASARVGTSLSNIEKGFRDLGLSLEDWQKLGPEEQIIKFGEALDKIQDPVKRMDILGLIFGRLRAAEMAKFFEVFSEKRELGLKLTDEDLKKLDEFGKDQREMDQQFHLLVATIGVDLYPVWQTFHDQLKDFWQKHGPEVVSLIKDLSERIVPILISIIGDLSKAVDGNTTSFSTGLIPQLLAAKTEADKFFTALDNLGKALDGVNTFLSNLAINIHNFMSGVNPFQTIINVVDDLLTRLGILNNTDVSLNIVSSQFDTYHPVPDVTTRHYASGGIAVAGTPAVVGEYGPELIIPLQDSMVYPTGTPKQMGMTFNVIIQASSYDAGRSASKGFVDGMRSKGINIVGGNG